MWHSWPISSWNVWKWPDILEQEIRQIWNFQVLHRTGSVADILLYQPERLSVQVEACEPHKKETDSESFSLFGRVPVAFEKRQISQLEGK